MVKEQSTSTQEKQTKKPSAQSIRRWLQDAYYAIWSLVGIVILVAVIIASFSSTSLIDMVAGTSGAGETPTQQAPAQSGAPTEDQLNCVSDELGEERLSEIQQGAPPKDEEATVIQECLAE